MRIKMKLRFCFHFVFYFHFCFCFCFLIFVFIFIFVSFSFMFLFLLFHFHFYFYFHFHLCFCFHFRFCFCFSFLIFIAVFFFFFFFFFFLLSKMFCIFFDSTQPRDAIDGQLSPDCHKSAIGFFLTPRGLQVPQTLNCLLLGLQHQCYRIFVCEFCTWFRGATDGQLSFDQRRNAKAPRNMAPTLI